jgi:hypothetical protein
MTDVGAARTACCELPGFAGWRGAHCMQDTSTLSVAVVQEQLYTAEAWQKMQLLCHGFVNCEIALTRRQTWVSPTSPSPTRLTFYFRWINRQLALHAAIYNCW